MSDISEQLRDCVNRDDLPDWKLVLAAADRIEKLEAALRKYADDEYNGYNADGAHARKALEGKDG